MYKKNSLNELYDCLKKFHLSDSLYVIGAVNAALKFGSVKADTKNIPPWITDWLQRRGRSETERRSISVMLTRMARYLLLSSANDHKGIFLDLNSDAFNKAYNLVRDLHDTDVEGDGVIDFSIFFGRTAQWQFPLQTSRKTIIGRGYLLFIELMQSVQTDYDFAGKFKAYFNLSLEEFMMTGYAMWLISNGTLDYEIKIERPFLNGLITIENQQKFLNLSSGIAKDYRIAVRGNEWQKIDKLKEIYGLDPFVKMPAIAVERSTKLSSTTYVVPQAKYFLDRGSSGIFYLLSDKEMLLANPKGNPFRIAFGKVYRAYVGKHLSQSGKHVFIDLDYDFPYTWTKMMPDFALVFDELCLLIEVKTTLLNVDSRTYQEPLTLRKEAANGSLVKAVNQLDTFRRAILNNELPDPRFTKVSKVLNIIVGYEDVYSLNNTLLPLLEEIHGDPAKNLQLGCITDIDAIGTAISNNDDIITTLFEKANDVAKRSWGIATIWSGNENHPNPILDDAFSAFQSKIVDDVKGNAN
ncbi:hypothetical protein HDF19_03350 [Mucilaginibacter sp. E4BP6]|uniref:hypothetical protein n=1 Tax=Mucilaginibacter sp. E4BP6 TaxID=2723089 RepID=UPI0015CB1CE7|nr:hypothetical protein [Mucilaginibacter sp. E4BP6]NYE64503.1 hypothetical protein [Mucilaginibacter sp. E4BP6]